MRTNTWDLKYFYKLINMHNTNALPNFQPLQINNIAINPSGIKC